MKITIQIIAILSLLLSPWALSQNKQPNVAFFYNDNLPVNELQMYDWVILQGDLAHSKDLEALTSMNSTPIAYLSFGEINFSVNEYKQINRSWLIGENTDWNSGVLDWRKEEVQDFLINRMAGKLWQQGFKGFFLDTLDSYQLSDAGKKDPKSFNAALIQLISKLKQRFPQAIIITNRGFEAMPQIHHLIDAVAFESLYAAYNVTDNSYSPVPQQDSDWLLTQAQLLQQQYQLPVIAIDYIEPKQHIERDNIAEKIKTAGLIPWVADGHLQTLGRGLHAVTLKTILGVYDDPKENIFYSGVHRLIAMPLEYLGYQLGYSHITTLPELSDLSHLAGIVVYLENNQGASATTNALCRWLTQAHNIYQLPITFMNIIPPDDMCAQLAGIRHIESAGPLERLNSSYSYGKFQGKFNIRRVAITAQLSNYKKTSSSQPWLTLQDSQANIFHPIATTNTGGYALDPYIFEKGYGNNRFWLFNPFEFLSQALKLKLLPALDVTTESGRRILTSHIDGDGFVSRAQQEGVVSINAKLNGQVILDEILEKYPIPHTVSIIQGEISAQGQYPKLAQEAEAIARNIFVLPWVEIASHTFSHPFYWLYFEGDTSIKTEGYGYHMPIPGYQADLNKEITGSVDYINQLLAPANKKVQVFLWSGDALPGEKAMTMVARKQLLNVNGGDTKVVNSNNSLAYVWPVGRPVGDFYQIYAPVMNENVYTNLWKGPYYGYRKVIETFELLDQPKRLKPISIYYHFYSASKIAGLKALNDVYQWAYEQQTTAMYLSDYALRANAFYHVGLAKMDDNSWLIKRPSVLKTVRIPISMGMPDIANSKKIIGFKRVKDNYYIHLAPTVSAQLMLIPDNNNKTPLISPPYLYDSNGIIDYWALDKKDNKHWKLTISATAGRPLEIKLANRSNCEMVTTNTAFEQKSFSISENPSTGIAAALKNNAVPIKGITLKFKDKKIQRLELDCQ